MARCKQISKKFTLNILAYKMQLQILSKYNINGLSYQHSHLGAPVTTIHHKKKDHQQKVFKENCKQPTTKPKC